MIERNYDIVDSYEREKEKGDVQVYTLTSLLRRIAYAANLEELGEVTHEIREASPNERTREILVECYKVRKRDLSNVPDRVYLDPWK